MAEHRIQMAEPRHELLNSDIDFWVHSDNIQLGHLHISKGGLDWYAGKSSVKKHSMTWERFAEIIEDEPVKKSSRPKRKRR